VIDSNIRAYHEAGHAVAAALLGIPVARISIRPDGHDDGRVSVELAYLETTSVDDRVKLYLAGIWGAWMDPSCQDPVAALEGAATDYRAALALLCDLDESERDSHLQARGLEIGELLRQDHAQHAVHVLAGMLLEREELDAYTDIDVSRLLVRLRW